MHERKRAKVRLLKKTGKQYGKNHMEIIKKESNWDHSQRLLLWRTHEKIT